MSTKFQSILKEKLEGYRESTEGEILGFCPFPHESGTDAEGGTRSLAVNYRKGVWVCFSCQRKGNDASLISQLLNISSKEAKKKLGYAPSKQGEVPQEEVIAAHQELLNNDEVLDYLKERGITRNNVLEYQLGYQPVKHRLWIPIRDEWGRVINVRQHLIKRVSAKSQKTIGYKTGWNEVVLFPFDEQVESADSVVLCEGELDTIVARNYGFQAITVTGGAGTWNFKFNKQLAGKYVYIAYDTDEAGVKGAEKVAKAVLPVAAGVFIVNLDLPKGSKDVTDYFAKQGYTSQDFELLLERSEQFKLVQKEVNKDNAVEVDLARASLADLFGKRIKLTAIVAGKDLTPYIYPKNITITCPTSRKACAGCGLAQYNGVARLSFDLRDEEILKLIRCEDKEQRREIARKLNIITCHLWTYLVDEAGNIEEIKMIPEINYEVEHSEYVMRTGFVMGHGIRTNMAYTFEGVAGVDPNTQHAVPIFDEAQAVRGSLDDYNMTPELLKQLEIFKVPTNGIGNDPQTPP